MATDDKGRLNRKVDAHRPNQPEKYNKREVEDGQDYESSSILADPTLDA